MVDFDQTQVWYERSKWHKFDFLFEGLSPHWPPWPDPGWSKRLPQVGFGFFKVSKWPGSKLALVALDFNLTLVKVKEPAWIFNGQEGGAFDWECFYFCSYHELVLFCETSPHIPNWFRDFAEAFNKALNFRWDWKKYFSLWSLLQLLLLNIFLLFMGFKSAGLAACLSFWTKRSYVGELLMITTIQLKG